jgi:hypothetical protein
MYLPTYADFGRFRQEKATRDTHSGIGSLLTYLIGPGGDGYIAS